MSRTITRIGKKNYDGFSTLLMGARDMDNVLCLGCIEDGKAVGALAVLIEDERADLLHLYVSEKERKKGVGTELMEAAMKLLKNGDVGMLSVSFPCDAGLTDFFDSMSFLLLPGESMCTLDVEEALNSKAIKKILKTEESKYLKRIPELSKNEQERFRIFMNDEGIREETLPVLSLDVGLSAVVIKNNWPVAMLLAAKQDDQCLIHYLCNAHNDEPDNLMYLIRHLTNEVKEDKDIKELCFFPGNDAIRDFAEKIIDGERNVKEVHVTDKAVMFL